MHQLHIKLQAEEARELNNTQRWPFLLLLAIHILNDGKVYRNLPTLCLSLNGTCPGKCQSESFESKIIANH